MSDQTSRQRRYDRQLRLWGEHGQMAMEDASVCLLNGSATGAETLKNLVLPGMHCMHALLLLTCVLSIVRAHPPQSAAITALPLLATDACT